MAASSGVILAVGGITFVNQWIGNGKNPVTLIKIPLATGIAALLLAGFEHLSPQLAMGIAWIALVTALLTGSPRSPAENALRITGL